MKKLGECTQSIDYGMNAAAIEYDGQNKYIRITDIDEVSSKYIANTPVSPDGELQEKYLVEENDILFARTGASTGKTYLYDKLDGKLYFAGFLIRAKVRDEYSAHFVFAQTQTTEYNKWVKLMSMRSGQPGINSQEYASYQFWIPTRKEQDKIASFLALIDERILTQSKIIEGLKELKASLSKQIFSRKLRFKDENGNDFPEWVETKLGEIAETYSGGTPTSTNNSYYIGNIPFIKSGEISSDKTEQFINEEALKNSSAKMVSKGDLLLALYGATSGEVAISQIAGAINQAVLVIRTEQNTNYLHHFLRCNKENIISTYLQGGQGNLSAQIIKNIIIKLPSLIEQKKVANFLSKIDNKVEVETTTFDLLTKQKKYLLRQIFI